jgi:hypothetical protein
MLPVADQNRPGSAHWLRFSRWAPWWITRRSTGEAPRDALGPHIVLDVQCAFMAVVRRGIHASYQPGVAACIGLSKAPGLDLDRLARALFPERVVTGAWSGVDVPSPQREELGMSRDPRLS